MGTSGLAAQAHGAGDVGERGGGIALGLAFLTAGPSIIDLMATAPEVCAAARVCVPWIVVAPVIGIASWMSDGIFIGATLARQMRNAMPVSVVVYIAARVVLPPQFGNHGQWAALMVLNLTQGATMAFKYRDAERAAA